MMIRNLLVIFLALGFLISGKADPFRNLGFEEADTSGLTPGQFSGLPQLAPGWQIFQGTRPASSVWYDRQVFEDGDISLFDSPIGSRTNFSLLWTEAFDDRTSTFLPTSILQTGDVPADAKSLRFTGMQGRFSLKINGNDVPMILDINSDWVVDVSAFSGQNVELKLTDAFYDSGGNTPKWGWAEARFLPAPVPEPTTWAIIGCGALLILKPFRRIFTRS